MLETIITYLLKIGYYEKINEFNNSYYSHPNYPSLLAITDSLNQLNIENIVVSVPFNNFKHLPDYFIAELNIDNKRDFFIIEKTDNEVSIFNKNFEKKKQSIQNLNNLWTGIVFLVEENEKSYNVKTKSKYLNFILLTLIGLCSVLIGNSSLYSIVQIFLTIIGILLSLEINKSFFNDSKNVESKFCNYGNDFSCNDIIKSNIAIFKKHLSFVDLPILFFSFSYLLQIIFPNLIMIIGILSLLSLPIVLYSIYYQKFKVKKWCILCLSVSLVLVLNSILFFLNFQTPTINFVNIFNGLFLISIVYILWKAIKKIILRANNLQNQNNILLRFKRNKEVFEKISKKVELNNANLNLIEIGNEKAKNTVTLFVSPSCPHCHKAFEESLEIIEKFPETYNLKIGFNVNYNNNENPFIEVVLIIQKLFSSKGDYKNALIDWHIDRMEIEKWKQKWGIITLTSNNEIEVMKNQFDWCLKNDFNYAPVRIFNSYLLDENYDLKDIFYFIED